MNNFLLRAKEEADFEEKDVCSAFQDVTTTESLSLLLKSTQNAQSSSIKTISTKFTVVPEAFESRSDYFETIDELCVRAIASKRLNELKIWETVDAEMQKQYNTGITFHLCRKRLWSLSLRHLIVREKNSNQMYKLHPKYSYRIREAITNAM